MDPYIFYSTSVDKINTTNRPTSIDCFACQGKCLQKRRNSQERRVGFQRVVRERTIGMSISSAYREKKGLGMCNMKSREDELDALEKFKKLFLYT